MSEEEKYKALKKDYIDKSLVHQKLLEKFSYEDFSEIGIKGILASSRLEATTSYSKLLLNILDIKVKIPSLPSKGSV